MKRPYFSLLALLLLAASSLRAGGLGDVRRALQQSSLTQVQEKVYLHTDNQCYFVGDTLWYKAYVVRADNLQPTDLSRILYVELLSPDGLLVERQQVIVAPEGYTCGQFALQDSLYSGYYELRAYTRWMLNFGVSHHRYTTQETWQFYNRQMAADYYRQWDGLYSRVLPFYSKPDSAGDYDARRMYQRPKTRLPKAKKERLYVSFYPEGGHLVEGLEGRVAFSAEDQEGEAVSVSGVVTAGDETVAQATTTHGGRGVFSVTPGTRRLKARFVWRGKTYTFDLPQTEEAGVAMSVDDGRVTLRGHGLGQGGEYALSVLCRGTLCHFATVDGARLEAGHAVSVSLPVDSLPTGVNDVTLFDGEGRILADRLFFVGAGRLQQAMATPSVSLTTALTPTTTFQPYEQVSIGLQLPPNTTFSLSVRDTSTDEPTYNDGNLMTDLLLSSELRGFIAQPASYFERDDAEHRQRLDHLMMVQGWRKYPWRELADTAWLPRYQPERTMTVSGGVYKMLGITDAEQDEVTLWQNGVGMVGVKNLAALEAEDDPWVEAEEDDGIFSTATIGTETTTTQDISAIEYGDIDRANDDLGVNHGSLKREVLVEAELMMGTDVVSAVQKTRGGRFVFEIPPFYGATFLNMKAYRERDSLRKAMTARTDATVYREDAFADYYVKRDMPYPVFTRPYSFYEKHAPEWEVTIDEDSLSELSMENDVHQLATVNVKGHRRGKRAQDWQKPAFVRDAYDLYNDVTDYGLSFGKYDMRQFPLQVAKFLYGNMGRSVRFNVDGRLNGQTYWRNYSDVIDMGNDLSSDLQRSARHMDNRAAAAIYNNLKLARLQDVRVFSDYEPRNEDSTMVVSQFVADATVEMVPIADDGRQVVYRDRHIYLHGLSEPALFYQPDYSRRSPGTAPADYRRTLYWNPNARSDDEGHFTATFYNNGKQTRVKVSAAGVTRSGQLFCR